MGLPLGRLSSTAIIGSMYSMRLFFQQQKKKSALKGPTDLWMVPVVPSPVAIHSLVDAQFFKQPCVEQPAVQLLQSLMICRELASCVQCSLSEYSAECVTLPRSKRGLVLDEKQCVISIRP